MKNKKRTKNIISEELWNIKVDKKTRKPSISWRLFNKLAHNTLCSCSEEEILEARSNKMFCNCIIAPSSWAEDAHDLIMKETGAITIADNISKIVEMLANELLIDHEKGYM